MSENVNTYWNYVTGLYPEAQFDFFYRSGELHFWPDGATKDAGGAPWGCIRKGEEMVIMAGAEANGTSKRLTHWNGKKWILPQGAWREIAERLAAYENTGLEPEELTALINREARRRDTTVGQRLREERLKAGMTQIELSSKLNLPSQSISNWERNVITPRPGRIQKIADALGCDPMDIA